MSPRNFILKSTLFAIISWKPLKIKFIAKFFTNPFMKKILINLAFVSCLVLICAFTSNAQYTETFETQTPFASSFTSSGQSFTLTNSFTIYSSRAGFGYQHSNRFVDNSNNVATNQINAIKTTDAARFTIKSLWLYISSDGGSNPSTDGSLIITGKLAGVTQFVINKTTGFSASFGANNGFSFLDFTTEGGANNSTINIDEIQFQLQGNFNYIGIDNFTWVQLAVLPISLVSYSALVEPGGNVKLSWKTAYENNTSHFIIEKSTDGRNFSEAGSVNATGNSSIASNYTFIDAEPSQGINYYRLIEVNKDGLSQQAGITTATIFSRFTKPTLYPNPVINGSFTLNSEWHASGRNVYLLTDISGRILQKGNISSARQEVNVSQLAPGNYTIKLGSGEVIKWVKN